MNRHILILAITAIIALTIGFFAGMEYKAYQIRSAINDAVSGIFEPFVDDEEDYDDMEEVSEQVTATTETDEVKIEEQENDEEESGFVDVEIGELAELATLAFTITDVREAQTISGTFGSPEIAQKGAKFVLLDVEITNTTNAGFDFFPDDGFRLVDADGREFETYEYSIGAVENYLNVRSLAPGIMEDGTLVYEIPATSESYYWRVRKGGTNETYRVLLK